MQNGSPWPKQTPPEPPQDHTAYIKQAFAKIEKHIREASSGAAAVAALGILMGALMLFAFDSVPDGLAGDSFDGIFQIFYSLVYLGLAFGIYRRSRACAIIAMSVYAIDTLYLLFWMGIGNFNVGTLFMRVAFFLAFLHGLRYCFKFHALAKKHETTFDPEIMALIHTKPKMKPLRCVIYILIAIAGIGIGISGIFGFENSSAASSGQGFNNWNTHQERAVTMQIPSANVLTERHADPTIPGVYTTEVISADRTVGISLMYTEGFAPIGIISTSAIEEMAQMMLHSTAEMLTDETLDEATGTIQGISYQSLSGISDGSPFEIRTFVIGREIYMVRILVFHTRNAQLIPQFFANFLIDEAYLPYIPEQAPPDADTDIETEWYPGEMPPGLTDDLDSLSFSLNGVIYTLPLPFSELEALGWRGDGFDLADRTLYPRRASGDTPIRNGNQRIIAHFINLSDQGLPTNETYLSGFFTRYDHGEPPQIFLPGDIRIGRTYEEVLQTHGEPHHREGRGETELLRYHLDNTRAFMRIDRETNLVISMNLHLSDRGRERAIREHQPDTVPTPPDTDNDLAPEGLSPYLDSFMFSLDGVLYTLPFPFAELADNGWVGDEDDFAERTANPRASGGSATIRNGGHTVRIDFFNPTEYEALLTESYVSGISISTNWHEGTELIFPGNIRLGDTYETLLHTHGDPYSWRENIDGSETFTYNPDQVLVSFVVALDTDWIHHMSMSATFRASQTLIPREPIPHFEPDDFPAAVSTYETPTELGGDWWSFTLRVDGDLYRLPAPMAAFLDNGWTLHHDGITIGPTAVGFAMRINRDGNFMRAWFTNYDTYHRPVAHTFVTRLDFDFQDPDTSIPIELPGGITEHSTIEEMIAVFGAPADFSEDGDEISYYFGTEYAGITVIVHRNTGAIQEISVIYRPESPDVILSEAPGSPRPEAPEEWETTGPSPLILNAAFFVPVLIILNLLVIGSGVIIYVLVRRSKQP